MNRIVAVFACLVLVACEPEPVANAARAPAPQTEPAAEVDALAVILDAQPEEVRARYQYRHPQETIGFFGIEPGMTVVEGLPGGGWYTKILLPWLGKEGHLIGADYSLEMYPNFRFADEEFMAKQASWTTTFVADSAEWGGDNGASASAFYFGSMPAEFAGTVDVFLMIRVLHNLARFESKGNYLTEALNDAFAALKPGGTLGIVQHHARDEMSDEFADGSHGYLKKAFVIAAAERAGFEFVAETDILANPKDQPSEDDGVWRLPPTFGTSADNPELRAEFEAVGESNRMTLKFRKPE